MKYKDIVKKIGVWSYNEEKDLYISNELDLSEIYRIKNPGSIYFNSESEIESNNEPILNFNKMLPKNVIVQFVYVKNKEKEQVLNMYLDNYSKEGISKEIIEAKKKMDSEAIKNKIEMYLMITVTKKTNTNIRTLAQMPIINEKPIMDYVFPKNKSYKKELREKEELLETIRASVISSFSDYEVEKLSKEESYEYIQKITNGYYWQSRP